MNRRRAIKAGLQLVCVCLCAGGSVLAYADAYNVESRLMPALLAVLFMAAAFLFAWLFVATVEERDDR